jgi:Fe-Mn family superoxide dismutase
VGAAGTTRFSGPCSRSTTFGSYKQFKEAFAKVAAARCGAGWVWLYKQADGSLQICSTPYQDNPLMPDSGCTGTPVLGLDVWEHA